MVSFQYNRAVQQSILASWAGAEHRYRKASTLSSSSQNGSLWLSAVPFTKQLRISRDEFNALLQARLELPLFSTMKLACTKTKPGTMNPSEVTSWHHLATCQTCEKTTRHQRVLGSLVDALKHLGVPGSLITTGFDGITMSSIFSIKDEILNQTAGAFPAQDMDEDTTVDVLTYARGAGKTKKLTTKEEAERIRADVVVGTSDNDSPRIVLDVTVSRPDFSPEVLKQNLSGKAAKDAEERKLAHYGSKFILDRRNGKVTPFSVESGGLIGKMGYKYLRDIAENNFGTYLDPTSGQRKLRAKGIKCLREALMMVSVGIARGQAALLRLSLRKHQDEGGKLLGVAAIGAGVGVQP